MTTDGRTQVDPDAPPITVTEIWCYPVKSCAGIRVAAATITNRGIAFDRQWMVVDG